MGTNKVFYVAIFTFFSWLHSPGQSAVRNSVVAVYASQVGVKEEGNNRGAQIREYQKACGFVNQDVPWCACFVTWVYKALDINCPKSPALAASWFPVSKVVYKKGQKNSFIARKGDLVGLYFPNLGRIAHIGFFHTINQKQIVTTLEGNTNDTHSREGDRVMVKKRMLGTIYAISNWIDLECHAESGLPMKYHVMRPGETLYRLSVWYGVSVEQIKAWNGLKDNVIKVNQRIRVG